MQNKNPDWLAAGFKISLLSGKGAHEKLLFHPEKCHRIGSVNCQVPLPAQGHPAKLVALWECSGWWHGLGDWHVSQIYRVHPHSCSESPFSRATCRPLTLQQEKNTLGQVNRQETGSVPLGWEVSHSKRKTCIFIGKRTEIVNYKTYSDADTGNS